MSFLHWGMTLFVATNQTLREDHIKNSCEAMSSKPVNLSGRMHVGKQISQQKRVQCQVQLQTESKTVRIGYNSDWPSVCEGKMCIWTYIRSTVEEENRSCSSRRKRGDILSDDWNAVPAAVNYPSIRPLTMYVLDYIVQLKRDRVCSVHLSVADGYIIRR